MHPGRGDGVDEHAGRGGRTHLARHGVDELVQGRLLLARRRDRPAVDARRARHEPPQHERAEDPPDPAADTVVEDEHRHPPDGEREHEEDDEEREQHGRHCGERRGRGAAGVGHPPRLTAGDLASGQARRRAQAPTVHFSPSQ